MATFLCFERLWQVAALIALFWQGTYVIPFYCERTNTIHGKVHKEQR